MHQSVLPGVCCEKEVHICIFVAESQGVRVGERAKERGLDLVVCWGWGQGSLDSD